MHDGAYLEMHGRCCMGDAAWEVHGRCCMGDACRLGPEGCGCDSVGIAVAVAASSAKPSPPHLDPNRCMAGRTSSTLCTW